MDTFVNLNDIYIHIPVLLNEVIKYLNPKPGDKIIDATFGAGGHATAILKKIKPGGKILGIEIDKEFFEKSKERFRETKEIVLVNGSYTDLAEIAKKNDFLNSNGILFDLGLSSWHLKESERGFTFLKDEPLDMRFSSALPNSIPAREIVNIWPKEEIEKVLKEFGEEKFAKSIAQKIIEARKRKPILNTFQLIEVIKEAVPLWYRSAGRKRHFATKTFQALRIAVNHEFENIKIGLNQVPQVLKKGGKIAMIDFHSIEDRIIKNTFRDFQKKGIGQIITKKPIRPSLEEIFKNPRSRSAKLRTIEIRN